MSPMQRGRPLDDETLAAMPEDERAFWLDFLDQGLVLVKAARAEGWQDAVGPKLTPPPDFAAKYRRALAEFNGHQYCQISQLRERFDFGAG